MYRLYNLDYLRGLAAFGIMVYHYLSWTMGKFTGDTFMGRLGIYAVSIFYILSGLTMYLVYINKMEPSRTDVYLFIKKRGFRIFPLLWLATIISLALSQKVPDFFNLFLNLTGLFGFVKWDTYFFPGVWSIGNELVFYAFFPIFISLFKFSKYLFAVFSGVVFLIYIYFAFFILKDNLTLSEQWKDYINPLNQLFLFLGGFLIGLFFRNHKLKISSAALILLFGLCLFVFYPAHGNAINLVTDLNRLVFTFSCFMICLGFYKFSIKLPDIIHKPLTLLGEASYSVYLLHPMVYTLTGIALSLSSKYFLHFPESVRLILSVVFTLMISYFVYEYFEKYFMKKGAAKKLMSRNGFV